MPVRVRPSAPRALREKEAAHRGGFFCVWGLVAVRFFAGFAKSKTPDLISFNWLLRVHLRVYAGSIIFVPTQNDMSLY
ncbi:hypothetical protein EHJ13_14685 [Cronobacter dublinensis]|uniref:Uncharacterized protein n=1 Tax=Cronobacter dublinensis TaxID=413497 RepID=A0A9Q4T8H6_9ENTR|nr:hypothetical protein [Cronobacter dublinensis]